MSILQAELKVFKAAQVSNTAATNGGRASYTEAVSGVNNNLFPDVSQAERLAGATSFRKAFYKNTNAADLALFNGRVFIENYTPGDDAVYFHPGSHFDLQNALTGAELLYGTGKLDADAAATDVEIDVLLENAAVNPFRNGQVIRISDKADIGAAGNEEYVTIDAAPSLAGSVVTLHLTPALGNAYLAAASRVAGVYEAGDVVGSISNVVVATVGSGDYDNGASPITCLNVGGVYDDWTLTFTSGTSFTCVGSREGAVGAGSTLADFSPVNAATGTPYFAVLAAGFSGAWASGDTLVFRTTPAHVPLWLKRIVPAGAAALAGDKVVLALDGETA